MAVATLEIGRHLKEDEQYLSSFGDQVVVWMVAGIGIAAEVVLVIFFVALFRGRRDKQVKAVGFSFIAIVLLGAMFGQAFLILQLGHVKVVEKPTWLGCAFQTWLLLLHRANVLVFVPDFLLDFLQVGRDLTKIGLLQPVDTFWLSLRH